MHGGIVAVAGIVGVYVAWRRADQVGRTCPGGVDPARHNRGRRGRRRRAEPPAPAKPSGRLRRRAEAFESRRRQIPARPRSSARAAAYRLHKLSPNARKSGHAADRRSRCVDEVLRGFDRRRESGRTSWKWSNDVCGIAEWPRFTKQFTLSNLRQHGSGKPPPHSETAVATAEARVSIHVAASTPRNVAGAFDSNVVIIDAKKAPGDHRREFKISDK